MNILNYLLYFKIKNLILRPISTPMGKNLN